jgi:L-lysine 6-transaminase
MPIRPTEVHQVLSKYMLADGLDLVLDLRKSHGCQLYDSRNGKYYLDCFSFFGTAPLGCNHPRMCDPEFIKKIGEVAVNNPSNSDIYTVEMAEFVNTFTNIAVPSHFKHLFFISGGTLAVENALKVAFDWKIRKNLAAGKGEKGTQIIHFTEAFHGRSGYTLSMTNTFNLNKIKYFTKFDWPRIDNPKIVFPLNAKNLEDVKRREAAALDQIKNAIKKNPDDIAGLIIEPIQAEGGDNHFRPEFFSALRKICDQNDIMFILDEVQTGIGLTGKMWAYQHMGVEPDIIAFGKKMQICGIMVSDRVDEVKDNVFKVSSRINSTWGGNLVDMVRSQRYLEIIKDERLVEKAATNGAYLLNGLEELQANHPDMVSNARGRGLLCAFDVPTPEQRDALKQKLYDDGLIILGCGSRSIRFRPSLTITKDELGQALTTIDHAL